MRGAAKSKSLREKIARHHAAESRNGAHGKIDAPGQNDEGHPYCQECRDGHMLGEDREIVGCEKLRGERGEQDEEQQQHQNGAGPQQEQNGAGRRQCKAIAARPN